MAAVPLFTDTYKAAVTSHQNTLLPQRFQSFSVVATKFCRGAHKHLRQVHKFFVMLAKSYFRPFKNKSAYLKHR